LGRPRKPVVMPNLVKFVSTGVPPEEIITMLETRVGAGKRLQKLFVNQFDMVCRFQYPLPHSPLS
jgi:hypothetical protein